jgi:hypothetical protein
MILSCHYFKTNFGNLKAALGTPAATAHFVPDTGPRCSTRRRSSSSTFRPKQNSAAQIG